MGTFTRSGRRLSRIAFLVGVGLAELVGCSSDDKNRGSETKGTGTLTLPLQTVASTGNVFRLRNATFVITNVRTGALTTLSSEDEDPAAFELTTLLDAGDYTVTLLDGWAIEQLDRDGSGGTGGVGGGPGGIGGIGATGGFTAGAGGGGFGNVAGIAGGPGKAGGPGQAGGAGKGGFFADAGVDLPPIAGGGAAGEAPGAGGMASGGVVGIGGQPNAGGSAGAAGGGGRIVPAQLISPQTQLVNIVGGGDAFTVFQFLVGDGVIDFSKGRLHIFIDVIDNTRCEVPEGALDSNRVLTEHSATALSAVSIFDAFGALAGNEGHGTDPVRLYQEIIDSYASAESGRLPDAIHCGDETTNGVPSLNGYPIECDRIEAQQFDNLPFWFATSVTNRIDLAPQNGAHCGQQRVTFANNVQGRMFLIFEAQIPNPHPELGIQGCAPLAQFWLDSNAIDDPFERGVRLAQALFTGHPELQAAGFGPFVTASNFTVGSGQIRSNNFDQFPWTLREFRLAEDGADLTIVPFPVGESPHGALWNEFSELPAGDACRQNFLDAAERGLLSNDPAEMSFVVDVPCMNSESRNDFSEAYPFQLSAGFAAELDERFSGTGLGAFEIATRAQFAGSCIGCHSEANGAFLGNGVFAPFSRGFVHVEEFPSSAPQEGCAAGDACFPLSQALRDVFLPRRKRALAELLGIDPVPNPCDDPGGTGGFPGTGGFAGAGGGASGTGGSFGGSAGVGAGGFGAGGGFSGPAPEVQIALPSADTPVDALVEQDAEIRQEYGEQTLSGRSAQATH